jgi:hypothetical protein
VLRRIFGPRRDEITGVEKTTQQGASCSVLLTKYYSGDQIKKNKIGRACSKYRGEERYIQGFGRKTYGKEATWKTLA